MLKIIKADLSQPLHAGALVYLLNLYALDPMGGGKALSEHVKDNLASALHEREDAHVILAFIDDKPVGLLNCIEGFSTFACKPLLNIHDAVVVRPCRGQGVAAKLFEKAEQIAVELGCCKLTLEVLEGNEVAKSAYLRFGFNGYQLDPELGKALFWEKKL